MASLEARVAGLVPCLASAKEGLKGAIDSLQRPAADGEGNGLPFGMVGSDHGEAFALIEIGDGLAGSLPGIAPFLQGGVVELAGHIEQALQIVALSVGRKAAVFVSADHGVLGR